MRKTQIGKVLDNIDGKIKPLDYALGLIEDGATVESLKADIARLREARALVAESAPAGDEAPKPRKPRTSTTKKEGK